MPLYLPSTGGVTDHGALTGLSDDDHTQYLELANNLSDLNSVATALTNLGLTASAAELNVLDGITSTTTELNYTDGVTSAIQTQLNAKAASGANTDITSVLLNQTGLVVKGADSNALTIKPNETLTAARTLNLVVGDAARTITLSGNPTLADWFDQSVKTTANPQFATIELGAASDTTLARSAAGKVTIEGQEITTASNTQTLTNKTLTAPTIADFTNAAHDHGDADDGGALANASVTSAKLAEAFFRGRYQQNTTDAAFTGYTVQMGWGFIVGDGTIKIEESVTFDDAFSSAPFVMVSYAGLRATADGDPDTIDDFNTTYSGTPVSIGTEDITTTGFVVNMIADTGATLLNTRNHGYAWIAIGAV